MNKIQNLKLNRNIKVLLLQVLKTNEITFDQANQLTDYFCDNGLIDRICIQFVDFSQKKVE